MNDSISIFLVNNFMEEVLVIVPTYNEIENLDPLVQQIFEFLPQAHILIVDDNSPDGTGQRAETLKQHNSHIQVLHREKKEGLGQAYLAGFTFALQQKYRYIVQMDADFSHPPQYLATLVQMCQEGKADLCLGSRYIDDGKVIGWSFWRRGLSYFGSLYARFWLRIPFQDLTGGYKCWKREVLEAIQLQEMQSTGYCFQIELTYRTFLQKFKIAEIPITFPERIHGQSKMSLHIAFEAAIRVPMMPWTIKLPPPKLNKEQSEATAPESRKPV